jgi:hypothetical protein
MHCGAYIFRGTEFYNALSLSACLNVSEVLFLNFAQKSIVQKV